MHLESLNGTRILTGVAQPFTLEATVGGGSQEVTVAWDGADAVASSTLLATHGQAVVLQMELRGGATLFSYAFE